jgi:hypothetical protein
MSISTTMITMKTSTLTEECAAKTEEAGGEANGIGVAERPTEEHAIKIEETRKRPASQKLVTSLRTSARASIRETQG